MAVAVVGLFVRFGSFGFFWEDKLASSAFGPELVSGGNEEVRDAYGVLPVGW